MKKRPVNVMLDEAAVVTLTRLEALWDVSRSEALRRVLAEAGASVGKVNARTGMPEREAPVRELETVVEERRPAVPAMMTGSQLARQQALARERRRGDETDQRPEDEDL